MSLEDNFATSNNKMLAKNKLGTYIHRKLFEPQQVIHFIQGVKQILLNYLGRCKESDIKTLLNSIFKGVKSQ